MTETETGTKEPVVGNIYRVVMHLQWTSREKRKRFKPGTLVRCKVGRGDGWGRAVFERPDGECACIGMYCLQLVHPLIALAWCGP